MTYDPDRDPAEAKKFAALYLSKMDALDHETRAMGTGEFGRTLLVAVVVWVVLVALSAGNATVIWFGWIAGLVVGLTAPSVGRWLSGGPWRDPREVRIAAERDERRQSLKLRGRWTTDADLLAQAREKAQREGRAFPGTDSTR